MKAFKVIFLVVVFVTGALAAENSSARPAATLLPSQFSGWQLSGSPQTSNDPAVADPANAALLKEYDFTDFQSGTYSPRRRTQTHLESRPLR